MNIHIARRGQKYGPYTLEDIKRYLAEGSISVDDDAWTDGLSDWVKLQVLLGEAPTTQPLRNPSSGPAPGAALHTDLDIDQASLDEILGVLGDSKEVFLARVEARIKDYISSRSFSDCLTFIEKRPHSPKIWKPEASAGYLQCLGAFCAGKRLNGHELDSALTEPVVAVVTEEFEALYEENSEDLSSALSLGLMRSRIFTTSLVENIVEITNAELPNAVKNKVALVLLQKLEATFDVHLSRSAASAVKLVAAKAVAVAVSVPITKSTAILIMKFLAIHIKVILAKVLASSAAKAAIATAVKKIVIAALLAGLVKLVGAKLGLGAGAAFMVVLIPLMIAFIAHEVHVLPRKLGTKVSEKVKAELSGSFESVNRDILSKVVQQVVKTGVSALASSIAQEPEIRDSIAELVNELR